MQSTPLRVGLFLQLDANHAPSPHLYDVNIRGVMPIFTA